MSLLTSVQACVDRDCDVIPVIRAGSVDSEVIDTEDEHAPSAREALRGKRDPSHSARSIVSVVDNCLRDRPMRPVSVVGSDEDDAGSMKQGSRRMRVWLWFWQARFGSGSGRLEVWRSQPHAYLWPRRVQHATLMSTI